jgi:soluble lytic murein transglycosylase
VELIRFKETRNYVQRVIENINVYKYTLNKDPIKIDGFFRQ